MLVILLLDPPERMSLSSTVPDVVPSDIHSSDPMVLDVALKNSTPPETVRLFGELLPVPGKMSLNSAVLPKVPVDVHSSSPYVPTLSALSRATKNNVPFKFTKLVGPPPGSE